MPSAFIGSFNIDFFHWSSGCLSEQSNVLSIVFYPSLWHIRSEIYLVLLNKETELQNPVSHIHTCHCVRCIMYYISHNDKCGCVILVFAVQFPCLVVQDIFQTECATKKDPKRLIIR